MSAWTGQEVLRYFKTGAKVWLTEFDVMWVANCRLRLSTKLLEYMMLAVK